MGEKKLAVNNKKKRILNISLAVIGIIVVGLLFNTGAMVGISCDT